MDFDPLALLLSMVVSGVGLVLFVYGKRQSRWPHMVAGLLFMIYPYFVGSLLWMLAIGVGLGAALWWIVWLGY